MASVFLLIVVAAVALGLWWIHRARPAWARRNAPLLQLVTALLFFSGVGAINALTGGG